MSYNRAVYSREQAFTGFHWQTKKGLREASINIKNEWPLISEIPKSNLDKLPGYTPGQPKILYVSLY